MAKHYQAQHRNHLAEYDSAGNPTGNSVCNSKGTVYITKNVLDVNCGSCEKMPAWQKAMELQDELEVLAEAGL